MVETVKLMTWRIFIIMAGLAGLPGRAAAEWQWSKEVPAITIGDTAAHPQAFLWIPPDCRRVRAVVFGQNNMIEEGILQDENFRRQLGALGIAEIYVAPTFDTWQDATNNAAANRKFDALLQAFADESGYGELKFAPVIPLGHSAMASFPWNFAAWNSGRTLAILSVHGDAPQTTMTGNGRPNLVWGDRGIDGIPGLMVMGEYEWLPGRLTPATEFFARHPRTPVAVLGDAGHGHFDYSDELIRYLVMFVRKAAAARLRDQPPACQPVPLKPVDPRDGWLMDCWQSNRPPAAEPAPYAKFTGDRGLAFWTFDAETAWAAEHFNLQAGKAPQLAGFVQDGKVVDQTPGTHEQIRLVVPPLDDRLTFRLNGTFLDAVPAGANPVRWTGLTNGAPLEHANGGGPVRLSRISGPVEQLGPDEFRISFNRSSIPEDRRCGDIWLLASHPGDARFKSTVQQALMKIPVRLTQGAAQRITFPPVPDQRAGVKTLKLAAVSDAGAPVRYYVREGPAEVAGAALRFTAIPPRAKFPVRVTVVAWQYGRTVEPKLQSAVPVGQTFLLTQ